MHHKHHTAHAAGVLLGVIFLGGTLGIVNGTVGNRIALDASASYGDTILDNTSAARITEMAAKRRLRREQRLQREERVVSDVGVTYPMQNLPFAASTFNETLQVALNTAFLSYDRLGIQAPINKPTITEWKNRNWRKLENQMQYGLLHGVSAYPHSPDIGNNGNVIIAGHSSPPTLEAMGSVYGHVFANLPNAAIGDRIEIRDAANRKFTYEVTRAEVVPSSYTKILLQDPSKKELVLFTCYPVGTTRDRFVVWADLVEEGETVATR